MQRLSVTAMGLKGIRTERQLSFAAATYRHVVDGTSRESFALDEQTVHGHQVVHPYSINKLDAPARAPLTPHARDTDCHCLLVGDGRQEILTNSAAFVFRAMRRPCESIGRKSIVDTLKRVIPITSHTCSTGRPPIRWKRRSQSSDRTYSAARSSKRRQKL